MTPEIDRLQRRSLAVVLIGALSVLALNLGGRALGVGDVLRYAQMVMEMRHFDSMIPTMDGVPYHEAAPLAAWLPYFSTWLLGGLNSASIVLPSSLAAFGMLLITFRLARVLSFRTGTIAVALAATCYLTWIYGRQSRIDCLTGFAHVGAVAASYFACRIEGRRRLLSWLVAGAFLGLGVASKGFFAPGILAVTLGPWMIFERRWRAMFEGSVITLLVASAITAAWFIPYSRILGPEGTRAFLDMFLGQETISKFGGDFGKVHGYFWYLLRGTPLLAPLSILAGIGMFRVLRHPREAHPLLTLSTCGIIFPVILLSLAGGKHLRYLIPLIPALAILSADVVNAWLEAPAERARRVFCWTARISGVVLAAAGVAAIVVSIGWLGSLGYAVITGVAAVAGGVFAVRHAMRPPTALLGLFIALAALISYHPAVFMTSPQAQATESYLILSRVIAPALNEGESLVVTDTEIGEPGALSPSELSVYLLPRWLELHDADNLPDSAVVLAREPKAGRNIRLEIDWMERGERKKKWYLLEPVKEVSNHR